VGATHISSKLEQNGNVGAGRPAAPGFTVIVKWTKM
jgi:hypothetical protein